MSYQITTFDNRDGKEITTTRRLLTKNSAIVAARQSMSKAVMLMVCNLEENESFTVLRTDTIGYELDILLNAGGDVIYNVDVRAI